MSEPRFEVNDRIAITGVPSGSKAHHLIGARGIVCKVWPLTPGYPRTYGVKLDGLDRSRWFYEADLEPETQSS